MTLERYLKAIDDTAKTAAGLSHRLHLLGIIRLLLVVGLVLLWIFCNVQWILIAGSAIIIAAFVWLMVRHERLSARKNYAETLQELYENELRGLDYDFSSFDGGAELADAGHSFGVDLDIFGDHSLFQAVNRTVIPAGHAMLAEWFRTPLTDRSEILRRQQAIRELAERADLRHQFYATGKLRSKGRDFAMPEPLTFSRFWHAMVWIVPALWGVLIALCMMGIVPAVVLGAAFVVGFTVANCKMRAINKVHKRANRLSATLESYSLLMSIVETADISAELTAQIRSRLLSNTPASRAIGQLSKKLGALDQRGNMFVMLLNPFVLWDIRSAIAVAKWHSRNAHHVRAWFDALGEFDALCSLANFADNHPEYVLPEITSEYFRFEGLDVGHPLMRECVRNDIKIDHSPYFMVITGANMAGKSTYLRVVGVNFVMACMGLPVCARRMTVSPCNLVTSLRTTDSLSNGESYFFAELKRLKLVVERLDAGEKLFVILDEILRGTNSDDKRLGSLGLVRHLRNHRHARLGAGQPAHGVPRICRKLPLRGRYRFRDPFIQLQTHDWHRRKHECQLPDAQNGDYHVVCAVATTIIG